MAPRCDVKSFTHNGCAAGAPHGGLPRSSGVCSSFPLPQRHLPQPATTPAHASRVDAWGSSDAASALPFQCNASKINPPKVNIGALIRSTPRQGTVAASGVGSAVDREPHSRSGTDECGAIPLRRGHTEKNVHA